MKQIAAHDPGDADAAGAAVLLIDPKFAHNVGGALRACAIFGADRLAWTPGRVPSMQDWPAGQRLPREERLRAYRTVQITTAPTARPLDELTALGYTPVAVEVLDNAETLGQFVHPERAVYVFGPEDGILGRSIRGVCHRFLRIPAAGCLNLAAAVNVVLYDRRRAMAQKTQAPATRVP
jgi:tRNA(Leu) C34 or U34 (ribose-2'-O)-methylase TrmL